MKETSVGIRELKNHLSKYLRRVKKGEVIIITEHGQPVGQILPIQDDVKGRLLDLAAAGVIEWNGQPLLDYLPQAVNRSDKLMSDLVAEDRG